MNLIYAPLPADIATVYVETGDTLIVNTQHEGGYASGTDLPRHAS